MGVPNLTRVDARARAELLSVSGYEVELDLTDGGGKPGERTFRSRTTIRFTASRPGAATFVDVIADRFREVTLNGRGAGHRRRTGRRTGWRCPTWPPTTCWSSTPTCSTRTPARACTGSSTRSTARSTSTRSSRPRTPSGCTPASTSPTSRATFALTVTAPAHWEVVSNGRARRSPRASAARRSSGSRPPRRSSPYVTALVAGPYHKVTDSHDGIDLGVYCRASLAEHLDADEILLDHQAGLRLVSPHVRLPLPVRQVRPAVRARVQRRRDGERGLRDVPRRLRLPLARSPTTRTSGAPTRSCTRWRTCGSATWSPCAGGTTSG